MTQGRKQWWPRRAAVPGCGVRGYTGTPMQFTAQSLNSGFLGMAEKLDLCDIDSDKWRQYTATHSGPMKWVYTREARTLRDLREYDRASRSV